MKRSGAAQDYRSRRGDGPGVKAGAAPPQAKTKTAPGAEPATKPGKNKIDD
jgi:hypothetical protein